MTDLKLGHMSGTGMGKVKNSPPVTNRSPRTAKEGSFKVQRK